MKADSPELMAFQHPALLVLLYRVLFFSWVCCVKSQGRSLVGQVARHAHTIAKKGSLPS